MTTRQFAHFPRLYYLPHRYVGSATNFSGHLDRCQAMGFSHVLLTPPFLAAENGDVFLTADHERLDPTLNSSRDAPEFLYWLAEQCHVRGLSLLLDLPVDQLAAEHPLVAELDDCFSLRREAYAHSVDPRHDFRPTGTALARFSDPRCAPRLADWWSRRLAGYLDLGVAGFRFPRPGALSALQWKELIAAASGAEGRGLFIAATYGMSRDAVRMLDGCGFDYLQSSLPWWDFRSSWLVEEYEALRLVAPLIAAPEDPLGDRLAVDDPAPRRMRAAYERMLTLSCTTGCGMMIPMGFEYGMRERFDPRRSTDADFAHAVESAPFDLSGQIQAANGFLRQEPVLRGCGVLRSLTGPNSRVTALLRRDNAEAQATGNALLILINPDPEQPSKIQDWRIVRGIGAVAETVQPLEAGASDVEIREESVLLAPGEVRLLRVGQDKPIKSRPSNRKRLVAAAKSSRIVIENVTPRTQDFQSAKHIVGDAIRVEADILCDGHQWLGVELQWRPSDETTWHRQKMHFAGAERWSGTFFLSRLGAYEFAVEAWIDRYGYLQKELLEKVEARVDLTPYVARGKAALEIAGRMSPGPAAAALHDALASFDGLDEEQQVALLLDPVIADHVAAAGDKPFYARSAVRHVEAERTTAAFGNWYEMPAAAPESDWLAEIGRELPKIRALGFDVVCLALPQFGTPERNVMGRAQDWQRLFGDAKRYGLEIAVEFPLRDAERIEDAPPAIDGPDLPRWARLRDALLEWSQAGLNLFRMRDPRDMPFAFWQWAIADLKRRNPAAIFVAGALSSDKIAFRLAKEGFSQSLTTLPWPMTKAEATQYFNVFQADSRREIFRPHLRVDAPEGHGVRSGADFLAQCALAATLSGSWSIARALDELIFAGDDPAKPVFSKALARLNWLRESSPALKSHRGLSFYNAYDERVLYYGRSMPERDDIILVAVNMSPRLQVETELEIPLWEWGLPDHAAVDVEDLFAERRFVWHGKVQRARFEPQRLPFAIWRIQPRR
ncbi:MAG TPA: maltotransferase domain-containing protein [Alphaproteobacteria bacterium]